MHTDASSPPTRLPTKASGSARGGASGERTIKRSTFTPEQLQTLEAAFAVNPLPNLAMRHGLAEQLGLSPRTVQVWFQNRRQKMKKLQQAASASPGSTAGSDPSDGELRSDAVAGDRSLRHSASTGSFELMASDFERLNHHDEPEGSAAGAIAALRRAGAPGFAKWTHDGHSLPPHELQPLGMSLSRPLDSMLGARLEGGTGAGDDYHRRLMRRLAALDRQDAPQNVPLPGNFGSLDKQAKLRYAESLDAAANLLFFSATAALLNKAVGPDGEVAGDGLA